MNITDCRECNSCWHAGNNTWRCMNFEDKRLDEIEVCGCYHADDDFRTESEKRFEANVPVDFYYD